MPNCPNCREPYTESDKACQHCGYALSLPYGILAPGTILQDRYEIQELLHTGDISYVYLAKDSKLYDRYCIVKQVKEPIESNADIGAFEQTILEIAKLSIPNIAMVLDHFVEGHHYFLVVEHITGKTLSMVFEENTERITEEEVIRWAISICDIVNSIHKQGIIYGDINPYMVMLTNEGFIKFVDFSISHKLYRIDKYDNEGTGKYGYTPPEQWLGKPEPQSDIFAIGATVYYLLTGFLPLSEEYLATQTPQDAEFNPAFPPIKEKNPQISSDLEAVLQKSLQPDANRRFSSATELGQALKSLIRRAPILSVDYESLDFANVIPGRSETKKLIIKNDGSGRLVGKLSSDRVWLEVSPATIDFETGELEILVTVNTDSLAAGFTDSGEISIVTNGGRKSININLAVSKTIVRRIVGWIGKRKWLVLSIIIIVIMASSLAIAMNTLFKDTTTPDGATVIFEDDFSNPNSGWYTGIETWGEGKYENGEYLLAVSETNYIIVGHENDNISPLGDFTLEVDARFASGPDDTWYGIGFRQQDKDNSYDFFISSGGDEKQSSYALLKQVNGTWANLKDWTASSHINKGVATNHLKVVCKGDQIEVYANDHKLAQARDSTFSKGKIIFEAAKGQGGQAHIYFDNLKIYVPN